MTNGNHRFKKPGKRFWISLALAVLLVLGIRAIFSFSRMEADASNSMSKAVTAWIQERVDLHFRINPKDSFWQTDLNNMVRKAAHVTEYFLLGLLFGGFFHALFRRQWPALVVSPVACLLTAMLDEGIQQFSEGRGPRWSDVRLDTGAAVIGVLLVAILFFLVRKVWHMHRRILALEAGNE